MSNEHQQSQLQQILIRRHLKQLHRMQKQVRSTICSLKAQTGATELDLHYLIGFKKYFAKGCSNALHQHADDFKDEGDRRRWMEFCDKRRHICRETQEIINIALYSHYIDRAKWILTSSRLN
jgi:hypothetical protein